ncbi:hypothetical protein Franean1_3302 [Parafrankia sp. EAN1pec]|nr:hypothetical protein Franean1_3302 [Frankia sp. EAN1pec]
MDEDLGVDGAGGLVEDEVRGPCEERPGDGEELLLAGAESGALIVDRRIVADPGRPARPASTRDRCARPPQCHGPTLTRARLTAVECVTPAGGTATPPKGNLFLC